VAPGQRGGKDRDQNQRTTQNETSVLADHWMTSICSL
jgi:hypothetical protein